MALALTQKRTAVGLAVVVAVVATAGLVDAQRRAAACGVPAEARRGKDWVGICKSCHTFAANNATPFSGNPNLIQVHGSPAGSRPLPGGRRNAALTAAGEAGVVWTDEALYAYLSGPKAFLTRTTGRTFAEADYMPYAVEDEGRRRDVVAYLKFIKAKPDCA